AQKKPFSAVIYGECQGSLNLGSTVGRFHGPLAWPCATPLQHPMVLLRIEVCANYPSSPRLCTHLLGDNVALFVCELFLCHLLSWNILKLIPLELEEEKDPE
ncbi:hypothetical protein A6R68_06963, partial [Neotoma lepida]